MRTSVLISLLMLPVLANLNAQVLDLTDLSNYADQFIPDYVQLDNTPPDNPITDIGATLGRVLFYDKRLSRNDTVSCASCHQQKHAFGDTAVASTGVNGTTGRHSMRLINVRFSDESRMFWDERANSVENQVTRPIQDHIEMGFSGTGGDPGFSHLVEKLSALQEYQVLFTGVFGDASVTQKRMQMAISQFVRSIQSFDSEFDAGLAQTGNVSVPFPNFSAGENIGKQLFLLTPDQDGAGCARCHRPPEFSIVPNSASNGIIASLSGGKDFTNTRSPSLRDLVDLDAMPHGGFMHNASLTTLLQVVEHYNAIPDVTANLDNQLRTGGQRPGKAKGQQLHLTDDEKNHLVSFLRTLTGNAVYTDEKWSDPFDENGQLPVIIFPVSGQEITFEGEGESRTSTITTRGVPNLDYTFQTSTDLNEWTRIPVSAAPDGKLSFTFTAPTSQEKQFIRLSYTSANE